MLSVSASSDISTVAEISWFEISEITSATVVVGEPLLSITRGRSLKKIAANGRMSGRENIEAMFAGIENLREGVTQLMREIEMLKAENEALKGHVVALQDQVERAGRYIDMLTSQMESATATAVDDRRSAEPMGRILPHDSATASAEAGRGKKKGGI